MSTNEATYPTADPTIATLLELQKRIRDTSRLIALDGDSSVATLSSGELTVDFGENHGRGVVVVNPESGTEDDLLSINTGSESDDEGAILIVRIASGDSITFKNSGNVDIESDFLQGATGESPASVWYCNGSAWEMVAGAGSIPLGASVYILQMNSAGDGYSFVDPKTVRGAVTVHKKMNTTPYSYSTNTERDVPDSDLTINIPAVATVSVSGMVTAYCSVTAKHGDFFVNVGGTNFEMASKVGTPSVVTIAISGIFEDVPAGSLEIKLREKPEFLGNAINVVSWAYTVEVIVQ